MKIKDTIISPDNRKAWGLFNEKGRLVEIKLGIVKPHFNNFEMSRNWCIKKDAANRYRIEEVDIVQKGESVV